jgi:hypothetical protein
MLTENQANYIAGIVDGEGSIIINKHDGRNNDFTLHIRIFNSNLEVLCYIRNITKLGNITTKSKIKNHKIMYIYESRRYEYKKFLTPILPYLVIKKRQAELMLQYLTLRKAHKYYPLTDNEIEIRENIFKEAILLNERGYIYLEEVERFPKLIGSLRNLTKNNYAYLAALVDGEGTLTINKRDKYYSPHIDYIQMLTYVGYVVCKIANLNRKNCYRWNLYVHQMKHFLIKVKPYLIVKKRQCDLLLEYFQLKEDRDISQLTNQEKIILELIYDDVKALNERGTIV